MARQQAKSVVDKFAAAEKDIDCAMKRYENYVGNQIANVASSSVPAEVKLESFILAMRDCKELEDLKAQILLSLKACKMEVCSVSAGFLKFIRLHVKPDNLELARLLGVENEVKCGRSETLGEIKKRKRKWSVAG